MRTLLAYLPLLACMIFMCGPMLLAMRKKKANEPVADDKERELRRLKTEVEALRSELADDARSPQPTEPS